MIISSNNEMNNLKNKLSEEFNTKMSSLNKFTIKKNMNYLIKIDLHVTGILILKKKFRIKFANLRVFLGIFG